VWQVPKGLQEHKERKARKEQGRKEQQAHKE
jgi:hypothetical protein